MDPWDPELNHQKTTQILAKSTTLAVQMLMLRIVIKNLMGFMLLSLFLCYHQHCHHSNYDARNFVNGLSVLRFVLAVHQSLLLSHCLLLHGLYIYGFNE